MRIQPVEEGAVVLLPTLAIFTIITSPATTPAGVLIVRFVLLVVAHVLPRCAIAPNAGTGMAVFNTATRTNANKRASAGIGMSFSAL
jgi:hypothetical protein